MCFGLRVFYRLRFNTFTRLGRRRAEAARGLDSTFFLFICRQLRSSFHPVSLDLGSRQITLNVDLWGFRVVYSGPSSLAHGSVRPGPARDRLSIVNGPSQSARFSS